jgi:hypothetical protein
MAIDRTEARRRVRTITAWAAGGAAVLTAAFAFGASRSGNVAKSAGRSDSGSPDAETQDAPPQSADPQGAYPQPGQGFAPPSASTGPPAGMSGGS